MSKNTDDKKPTRASADAKGPLPEGGPGASALKSYLWQGSGSDTESLGTRIRALRKTAGLTLEQTSAATGLSRAALSKIERDEMSPTFDSLDKLAQGLGLDLAALISAAPQNRGGMAVTRRGADHSQDEGSLNLRLLAPDFADRRMFVFEAAAKAAPPPAPEQWDQHASEDCLYVLAGALTVYLDRRGSGPEGRIEAIRLHAGDALQMDGRLPHFLTAAPPEGDTDDSSRIARVLWICVPFKA